MTWTRYKSHHDRPDAEFLRHIQKRHRPARPPRWLLADIKLRKEAVDGHPLYVLHPRKGGSGRAAVMLHGGGGMMGPVFLHWMMAARLARESGADVYFPRYPLAPESGVRSALAWLEGVYGRMLKSCAPEDITFVGDSAGANLASALCARAARKPGGVVLISPATGMDRRDERMEAMEKRDFLLSVRLVDSIGLHWGAGVGWESPDLNPARVDYRGFPPTLLYYGTEELFAPYMDELEDSIRQGAENLEVIQGPGLCHAWPLAWPAPESRDAANRIARFIRERS